MTTLIDLDDLERKARAATPGPWTADATDIVHDLGSRSAFVERIGKANARKNVEHMAANSPPVTLAMIARIRELEAAVRDVIRGAEGMRDSDRAHDTPWGPAVGAAVHRTIIDEGMVGLKTLLAKGAVLP